MADLASVADVGERVAAFLRAQRDVLAASGALAPLPQPFDIHTVATSRLAVDQPGLSITCLAMLPSADRQSWRNDQPGERYVHRAGLDLHFLLAARSDSPTEEQAMIAWAMSELVRQPLLSGVGDHEVIQLLQPAADTTPLFAAWRALGLDYRLSFLLVARNVSLVDTPAVGGAPVLTRPGAGELR